MTTSDPFFIGWLPLPDAYRRFLLPITVIVLAFAALLAVGTAFVQRNPGAGRWEPTEERLDGLAFAQPYAMLLVRGETLLLVEEGKFGATERVVSMTDGTEPGVPVRVTGTRLHRDGRAMLELAPGERGMRRLTQDETQHLDGLALPTTEVIAERITLSGEIIDPKCYLGAMRPGGGKTHKACAMLCVAGGVPPMLVTRQAGRETYYLLTSADGSSASEQVLPYVGDAVAVAGKLVRQGDMFVLRVEEVRR